RRVAGAVGRRPAAGHDAARRRHGGSGARPARLTGSPRVWPTVRRMPMPTDVGVVDLMIGFPAEDARRHFDFMKANLKDAESAEMEFPAEYMFKQVPNHKEPDADAVAITLGEMDRYGVD